MTALNRTIIFQHRVWRQLSVMDFTQKRGGLLIASLAPANGSFSTTQDYAPLLRTSYGRRPSVGRVVGKAVPSIKTYQSRYITDKFGYLTPLRCRQTSSQLDLCALKTRDLKVSLIILSCFVRINLASILGGRKGKRGKTKQNLSERADKIRARVRAKNSYLQVP